MKRYLIIVVLLMAHAGATVEDARPGPESMWPLGLPASGSSWTPKPSDFGELVVSVELTGPKSEADRQYVTPGKALEYVVTVKNCGYSEVEAKITVNPKDCKMDWFDWNTKTVTISPNGIDSEVLLVTPDMKAVPGEYGFQVAASAPNRISRSASSHFNVQDYDYVSETVVSGTGQFQLNKDVRSMNSGIKSDKDVYFSGSVDALVKNEYLVEKAKGRNPNFQEADVVDNYVALRPGDTLMGTETVKSSMVFGGIGARVLESYNLEEMEFKLQEFDIHQTGNLKKRAEFQTADNFTGYLMIDAKQTIPGQKSFKEREEYLGAFEIQRRMVFKDGLKPTFPSPDGLKASCFGIDC